MSAASISLSDHWRGGGGTLSSDGWEFAGVASEALVDDAWGVGEGSEPPVSVRSVPDAASGRGLASVAVVTEALAARDQKGCCRATSEARPRIAATVRAVEQQATIFPD
ncbi:MAG: hypothetical protein ACLQF1_18570 [Methyloceanibacter sp.]